MEHKKLVIQPTSSDLVAGIRQPVLASPPAPVKGFTVDTIIPASEADEYLKKKGDERTGWHTLFSILFIVDLIVIAVPIAYTATSVLPGKVVPDFVAHFVSAPLLTNWVMPLLYWGGAIVAGVTIVALVAYLINRHPTGKRLVGTLVWLFLLSVFVGNAFSPVLTSALHRDYSPY